MIDTVDLVVQNKSFRMMSCNPKTEVKRENSTLAKFSDADHDHIERFRRLGVNRNDVLEYPAHLPHVSLGKKLVSRWLKRLESKQIDSSSTQC